MRLAFDTPGVSGPALGLGEGDDRSSCCSRSSGSPTAPAGPAKAPTQLVALIVPRVADACTLDIVDQTGEPQRLAAHYEGPAGPELADYLAGRRPTREQIEHDGRGPARGPARVIIESTPDRSRDRPRRRRGRAAADDGPRALGQPAAAGLRPAARQPRAGPVAGAAAPDEQLPFLQALAERAARGFANTQLITELRRTRERLERILGSLAEAVTVHDERGKLVYANGAAATLLGAESVDELLAAEPGELAARFIITREDGTPVREDDLPGQRLLAGEESPRC